MFWCDPETGQSAHAWGRAMGWYMMGLVDVIELIPDGEQKDELVALFKGLASTLPLYADAGTGMWFQVMDRPYAEGNYIEATVNAMLSYAYLKGCRLGILDCFRDIVTAEMKFKPKPSGEGVKYLLEKYGLDPADTWYVGDRAVDMYCAKDAGVNALLYLEPDPVVTPTGVEDRIVRSLREI